MHFLTKSTGSIHTTAIDGSVVDHWSETEKWPKLQMDLPCRIDLACGRIETFTAECSTTWATSRPTLKYFNACLPLAARPGILSTYDQKQRGNLGVDWPQYLRITCSWQVLNRLWNLSLSSLIGVYHRGTLWLIYQQAATWSKAATSFRSGRHEQ